MINKSNSQDKYELCCVYREGTGMQLITTGIISGRKKARDLRDYLNSRGEKIWNCQIRRINKI